MTIEYKSILEVIMHRNHCSQDDDWENFNFPCACEHLLYKIDDVLTDYGQCEEFDFIGRSLERNFPGWGSRDLVSYPENKESLTIQNAYKNGSRYCFFMCPLDVCQEFETIIFRRLNEEYEDDPDILNLKDISAHLSKIAFEEDNRFSLVVKIAFIGAALHAKHPRGVVFNLNTNIK
jgi:hypothetical protein